MPSIPVKLIVSAVGLAFVFAAASPADAAKARKHRTHVAQRAPKAPANTQHRGTNLFPAGPLYNGPTYVGDDPDPAIRFQLWRDKDFRYGDGS